MLFPLYTCSMGKQGTRLRFDNFPKKSGKNHTGGTHFQSVLGINQNHIGMAFKTKVKGGVPGCTPVIPVFWRPRQEDHDLKDSFGQNISKLITKIKVNERGQYTVLLTKSS